MMPSLTSRPGNPFELANRWDESQNCCSRFDTSSFTRRTVDTTPLRNPRACIGEPSRQGTGMWFTEPIYLKLLKERCVGRLLNLRQDRESLIRGICCLANRMLSQRRKRTTGPKPIRLFSRTAAGTVPGQTTLDP
jgi:hypothetical protein